MTVSLLGTAKVNSCPRDRVEKVLKLEQAVHGNQSDSFIHFQSLLNKLQIEAQWMTCTTAQVVKHPQDGTRIKNDGISPVNIKTATRTQV